MKPWRPAAARAAIVVLIVLILSACAETANPTPQPEARVPTSTAAQPGVTPTRVLTSTPMPTETPTPTPTLSPSPSATPTATTPPSPTATATPTLTATSTPAAIPSDTATATSVPTATPTRKPGPRVWGVEMNAALPERGLELAQQAHVQWLRNNGLLWSAIEPAPGARDWQRASGLETELRATYQAGIKTILIVRTAPEWARQVPGVECSAVREDALPAMAAFIADAVTRYKDPPYGVKYWELGNEPDVDPRLVSANAAFGCWGNMDDAYYGGEYYARMLQVVYPAIKAADPKAKVLIGGLLLDADPAKDDKANPPGHFLEGILKGGGGDYFDAVSFHAYIGYDGQLHDWETRPGGWQERGGIVAGKVDLIREVLGRYGYEKPLFLTEGGLLCWDCTQPLPAGYLDAQAAYVPRLYLRSLGLGLTATLWYTLDGPGWHQAGLLNGQQQPRPAYQALSTMTSLLDGAQYLGPVAGPAGLEGYRLAPQAGGEVWVVWSREGEAIRLPVPDRLDRVVDHLGVPVQTPSGTLDVGFRPIYLLLHDAD